jgi:hypothetical protein
VRPRLLVVLLVAFAVPTAAEIYTWVDEQGVTHIADDPSALPEGARPAARTGREGLRGLWADGLEGPPVARAASPASVGGRVASDRLRRLLRGAVVDLERGETARAQVALLSVLRTAPGLPEPHWYLALLDRERGRYAAAEAHLRAFLAAAGEELEPWRASAERRLRELEDERRVADASALDGPDRWRAIEDAHFRVRFDANLAGASPDYPATVLRYLEEAREAVGARLGGVPAEAMGVVLYGKAAYLRAHRHRFSFQTVGFYDGRIHVVSAAHPKGELRALLFHEYAHAVFREQTGGDRPYWLNEGLAELSERAARSQAGLTRSERASLRPRIDEGSWIALRRLAPSFSGLDDGEARAAYITAAAAAEWLQEHTSREQRGRLLALLGQGRRDDEALVSVLGLTTDGLDAAVRQAIQDEFPRAIPAAGGRESG